MKKLFVIIAVSFVFFGCSEKITEDLVREDLFKLSYGNFEDQINLFNAESRYYGPDTHLFLKDGIFYISNSGGKKILQTSSYGDLLSIFYNADFNPAPSFLSLSDDAEGSTSTRKAIEYPFNHCSFITVSSNKHLYVVDMVPNERIEMDPDDNIALTNIILHFDNEGNFIDYIGQEGPGGTPFPNIRAIHTNANNDVMVVCRTANSIKIFWYNGQGDLIYKIPIALDSTALPSPYPADTEVFMNVDAVFPDYVEEKLYLKIDYYVETFDAETGVSMGNDYAKSCVYALDLQKNAYTYLRDIPSFVMKETDAYGTSIDVERVYQMIGLVSGNWSFLIAPQDSGYVLLLFSLKTGEQYSFNLDVSYDEAMYNAFTVTTNGSLAALLAKNDETIISVWHTDRYIKK